jgi:hypothetical protein
VGGVGAGAGGGVGDSPRRELGPPGRAGRAGRAGRNDGWGVSSARACWCPWRAGRNDGWGVSSARACQRPGRAGRNDGSGGSCGTPCRGPCPEGVARQGRPGCGRAGCRTRRRESSGVCVATRGARSNAHAPTRAGTRARWGALGGEAPAPALGRRRACDKRLSGRSVPPLTFASAPTNRLVDTAQSISRFSNRQTARRQVSSAHTTSTAKCTRSAAWMVLSEKSRTSATQW